MKDVDMIVCQLKLIFYVFYTLNISIMLLFRYKTPEMSVILSHKCLTKASVNNVHYPMCYPHRVVWVVYLSLCEPTKPEYKGSNPKRNTTSSYNLALHMVTLYHCTYCTVYLGCSPMFSCINKLGEFRNDGWWI